MNKTAESKRPTYFGQDIGIFVGLACALAATFVVDRFRVEEPEVKQPVELVFLLDQRAEMREFLPAMKANCFERAAALKNDGIDCRFAVIPIGERRFGLGRVPLTSDLDVLQQQLKTPAEGMQPAPSVAVAFEQAMSLDFRKDSQVLVFLISKSINENKERISQIATQIQVQNAIVIVQSDPNQQEHVQPLLGTNGRLYSMDGKDLTVASAPSKSKTKKHAASLLAKLAPDADGSDNKQLVKVKGLFSLRTAANRVELIANLGGSRESEMAVRDGLAWLARHQADDGHWTDEKKCESARCAHVKFSGAPIAETGLAVLAFQAGGNYYFNFQEYSEHVAKGLDWLVEQQHDDGSLFGVPVGGHYTWYQHGIATFALSEACAVSVANGEEPHPAYLSAARKAIRFMESHQYAQGGWQYALDSASLGDTSVTGWQVLALKSAMEAKINVAPETMNKVRLFFETCGDPKTGRTGYRGRGHGTDLTTAVGLIVQQFILKEPDSPLATKAVAHLSGCADRQIGTSGDFYTLYNAQLAMFLAGGNDWQQWNDKVRDSIIRRQVKSGCERGSWYHPHSYPAPYNRTLDTAWAVLALEVYYRYAKESNVAKE